MSNEEIIKILEVAKAEVEWNYPMDYQIALENAIKRIKDWERLKAEIKEYKSGVIKSSEIGIGIIMVLSYIEGCIAEMENEDGEN